MHGDNDERTIHRLEAFSDIVIGFCLAELGLSLVLPKSATDTFSIWESTTFFMSAFVFISVLWWLHHRTFSTFFVLTMPMVVLNFTLLCALVLTLYFLEAVAHVAGMGQDPTLFLTLFVYAFTVVYALMGSMLLAGLLVRRSELPAGEIRWAIGQLISIAVAVLFGIAAGTYALLNLHGISVFAAVSAVAIGIAVLRRLLLPRWLDRALAKQ